MRWRVGGGARGANRDRTGAPVPAPLDNNLTRTLAGAGAVRRVRERPGIVFKSGDKVAS